MRFVAHKTVEQQAILAVHRARQSFVKARTAQGNQIRGLLSEFGLVLPQGIHVISKRVPEILEDGDCQIKSELIHFIFTYKGNPVLKAGGNTWKKALKRASINNFRWHDLRHTWASWHVQAGTPLNVLQELGGWSDYSMVLHYAHLAHLVIHNSPNPLSYKFFCGSEIVDGMGTRGVGQHQFGRSTP